MGNGLQKMLKMYGRLIVTNEHGKRVVHVWDYAQDKPRIESEMTKEEKELSEKAKWDMVKKSASKNT